MSAERVRVEQVDVRRPEVIGLLVALTDELASAGYTPDQTFGYSADQLERAGVHLVGATVDDELVGVGGVEIDDAGEELSGELKRFYVAPSHRGSGVADAIMRALMDFARLRRVATLRLETGDRQHAAIAFYRRHGFEPIPRFGPYLASATSVCLHRSVAADLDPSGRPANPADSEGQGSRG
jgi:putative acetyltransferase